MGLCRNQCVGMIYKNLIIISSMDRGLEFGEDVEDPLHRLIDRLLDFQGKSLGACYQANHKCRASGEATERLRDMQDSALGCRIDYQFSSILDVLFGFKVAVVRHSCVASQFPSVERWR